MVLVCEFQNQNSTLVTVLPVLFKVLETKEVGLPSWGLLVVYIKKDNGDIVEERVFYAGHLHYYNAEYIPYLITAVFLYATFVAIPHLVLLDYIPTENV